MKFKIQHYLLVFLTVISLNSLGQVQVNIQSMHSSNGGYIGNCGTIDFGTASTITLQMYIELKKPYNQAVGDGELFVYTKKTSSSPEIDHYYELVQSGSWSGGQPDEFFYSSPQVSLSAQDFNASGGVLYVKYKSSSNVEYSSCNYPIEKDEVPSFSLSPINTTVSCGNSSPITFTVTPVNIPNGANVQYQWSVGNGWSYNGSSVSSFVTTTPSIQLVPTQYPPSNVRVTPVLNGSSYPQLTSTISLSGFNPSYQISGSNNVCDEESYVVNNLPTSVLIQSVASSNPNVATAILNPNGSITITKVSDGTITLSVVLKNSCLQTATLTKSIQVGIPLSAVTITGNSSICQGQSYTYTLSDPNHPCVNSTVWSVSPNLTIVSQSATSVTVTKNPFSAQYAGNISASFSGSTIEATKGVWVGTPGGAGLAIQKLTFPDMKVGVWSQIKASYIPIMYSSNDPLNVSYDWQIPNSAIISNGTNTAYKNVRPGNSGPFTIGVRVQCECGYGDWVYRTFNVSGGSGSTGPTDDFMHAPGN